MLNSTARVHHDSTVLSNYVLPLDNGTLADATIIPSSSRPRLQLQPRRQVREHTNCVHYIITTFMMQPCISPFIHYFAKHRVEVHWFRKGGGAGALVLTGVEVIGRVEVHCYWRRIKREGGEYLVILPLRKFWGELLDPTGKVPIPISAHPLETPHVQHILQLIQ